TATRRLATPVAEAKPTDGVDVLVPTALSRPARAVDAPSASTPRVAERMSGRTQSASTMRWHTVIVPSAFIAAARQAIAKGRAIASSNDHDRWRRPGGATHGRPAGARSGPGPRSPANPAAT